MRRKLFIILSAFLVVFSTSCYKQPENKLMQEKGKSQNTVLLLQHQIDSLNALGEFDIQVAKDYISNVRLYTHEYPEDPISAELLYHAALMAMTVAKATQDIDEKESYSQIALIIFDDIQKVYPEFSGIKNCLFNKGVIFDDILNDFENAEIFYRMYIATYPTDTLAISLEGYLQFFGKSPEEIMVEYRWR